jgi:FkbM family methyltransferase
VPVVRVDSDLRATLDGVTFNANDRDDVNFVDELFWKKAYNFVTDVETCVVDVGMNVGLTSLLFAAKSCVREVHSFEPFPETFARGMTNLSLNPQLSGRIFAHNLGLGDGDEDATFLVEDTKGDSGAQSTRNVEGGTPVTMSIRDAGDALRPILESARDRRRRRVVKIDCEGAEFAIFRSLSRAGLWSEIDLLMVEWHRVFAGRTQEELLRPLFEAGFVVIDLTPPTGNGFFYASRAPSLLTGAASGRADSTTNIAARLVRHIRSSIGRLGPGPAEGGVGRVTSSGRPGL